MTDQLTRAPSAVRVVLRSPLYRGATIALFLSGLGFSAAAPQIARFLVDDLGSSLTTAGLYYLTNLTAPIAGYLIGRRSDRTGRRLGLFRICAAVGFVGWLAIAFSTELWMPFVISAVVLGFAGAATSQLFAAIHDELAASPTPAADGVVSIVRMALTFGWVIGPVAGAYLAAQAGARTMLVATAVCTLAQILPLGTLRERVATTAPNGEPHHDGPSPAHVPLRAMAALLAFTGLYILVYAGEPIKYAYLPIYMDAQLHLPAALSGAIIGIQPLVELALMPVAVVVARRTGMLPLMVVGALFGVGANVLFATTGTAVGLFLGQILMGGVWGVFAGLGIIVAQRLLPTAIATASAIFISAPALSSALGGLLGGLGAGAVGLPAVFVVPAVLALVAAAGLLVLQRRVGERLA
ncbi:transporter [Leifsonia sp. Leaf336]|uniref:MFS transporter n=1 Tax=Leifsonia sp. Leaf336 TaxID=1736341 RepID=UPI0006FABA65|nr:MFS transporter [Leifsonia sp. Leaf336]KQR53927.1 transporter [Leifsonia sp. Leaf336]